jgi:hypothetical protein
MGIVGDGSFHDKEAHVPKRTEQEAMPLVDQPEIVTLADKFT